jgi:hypothetical protein
LIELRVLVRDDAVVVGVDLLVVQMREIGAGVVGGIVAVREEGGAVCIIVIVIVVVAEADGF